MTISRTFGACILTITIVAGLAIPANADTIWYNSESDSGGFSHLYSLDTVTQQIADRGAIAGLYNLTDIAVADNGVIYGVGWNNSRATGNSKLVQITPGSTSEAGSFQQLDIKSNKLQNTVNALTWHEGMLYAASTNGQLQTLAFDGKRWQVDNLGTLNDSSAGDLAFAADGTLYAALTDGRLATINLDPSYKDFGRAAVIGQHGLFAGLRPGDGLRRHAVRHDQQQHQLRQQLSGQARPAHRGGLQSDLSWQGRLGRLGRLGRVRPHPRTKLRSAGGLGRRSGLPATSPGAKTLR